MQANTKAKAARKPRAAKQQPAAKPEAAKPATEATAKPKAADDFRAESAAAAAAVAAYYSGASLPFKAASGRYADFRTDKPAKRATERQAALLAAMLAADTAGNIQPDGTFKRGGFRVPARLFDPKAAADATVAVQPETGCLSDMHSRVVHYVSGPLSGKQQRESVFRIDLARARSEISALIGDKLAKAALARLDSLAPAK